MRFRGASGSGTIAAMAMLQPIPLPPRIADPAAASALFASLAQEAVEVAAFAYLDGNQRLLGMRHARSAWTTMLDLPIRNVAADALAFDAAAVVMAHNHPSGDPTPSEADKDSTRMLVRALHVLDVRLLDHLVVTPRATTSFRTLGLL